jgi:hypothetical protein
MTEEKKGQDMKKKEELSDEQLGQAAGGQRSQHESGRPDLERRGEGRLEHDADHGKR